MIAYTTFIIDLHHINFGQVVLHFFVLLGSLAVDHVQDVLSSVWAHVVASLVLRRFHVEDGLADW